MQIGAPKNANENVMRINMTNTIDVDEYFVDVLKKKQAPILHENTPFTDYPVKGVHIKNRGFITRIFLYYM